MRSGSWHRISVRSNVALTSRQCPHAPGGGMSILPMNDQGTGASTSALPQS